MGMKILHTATRVIGPLYAPDGSVLYDPASDGALKNASKLSAYPLVLGTDVPHDSASGVGAAPAAGPFPWSGISGVPSLVNSFNGRTGTVTPASGDYSAADVGAAPAAGPFPWSGITGLPSLVNSFNGRSGTVSPASGDYSAAQVTNAAATNAANTFSADQTFTGKVIPNGGIVRSGTAAANLLFNSTAALGLQGWGNNGAPGLSSDIAHWAANGYNGSKSAAYFSYSGTMNPAYLASASIPAFAGMPYTLSGEIFNGTAGGYSYLQVNWYDGSGTLLSSNDTPGLAMGAGWTYQTLTVTAPTNTASAVVLLRASGAAASTAIGFSRVKFEQNDHASPYSQEADGNQTQWSSQMTPVFAGLTVDTLLAQGRITLKAVTPDVLLHDTTSGQATPKKYLRSNSGYFMVFNDANTGAVFAADDGGNIRFINSVGLQSVATPSTSAGVISWDGTHFRGGNGSAAETLPFSTKANGSWTPGSGAFNVAAGTVINIAAVPADAHSWRVGYTYLSASVDYPEVFMGFSGPTYTWWEGSLSQGSPSSLAGSVNSSSTANPVEGAAIGLYDGTYYANGYFRINGGYLQFVVTSSTTASNGFIASEWEVW